MEIQLNDNNDLSSFFNKYVKSLPYYFDQQKIKQADWSDRYRLGGKITDEEIALFLLITGDYTDETKIAKLTNSLQQSIQKKITKLLNIYQVEKEENRINDLIQSSEFKQFQETFRKNGDRLDCDYDVANFNDYINFYGTKNYQINILKEDLQDLKYLAFTLYSLEDKGITPQTYHQKVQKYIEFVKKGSEEFGIFVFDDIPFSNPSVLYTIMDARLTTIGFSDKQKNQFYVDFNIRKKIPHQKSTIEQMKNDMIRDLGKKFRLLPQQDQRAALYHNKDIPSSEFITYDEDENRNDVIEQCKNHKFSDQYYMILKRYKLKEFPFESIDPYYAINTKAHITENPWNIEGRDINQKQYLFNDKKELINPKQTIEKLDQFEYALMREKNLVLKYPDYKEKKEQEWNDFENDLAELTDDSHLLN
jgi:hypothetical protein